MTDSQVPPAVLEQRLGLPIEPLLLERALTHRSFSYENGNVPTTVDSKASVVGVYASTSRRSVRVLDAGGNRDFTFGPWVQVSRLGIPLVNEVLIPLAKKDLWNKLEGQGPFE